MAHIFEYNAYNSGQLASIDTANNKKKYDHYFYGHGKLLLAGEYFVLDGAYALAVPLKVGQSLGIKYTPSFSSSPKIHWKSYDGDNQIWFEAIFDIWHFECQKLIKGEQSVATFLSLILKQARVQNTHFLREAQEVVVETHLEFSIEWGLGSSSTLLYNIAKWAYISPFELLNKTIGGSGYDVACSQSDGPLLYRIDESKGATWTPIQFNPEFQDCIYFVYQGRKQNSKDAVAKFKNLNYPSHYLKEVSEISLKLSKSKTLAEFEYYMSLSEEIVAQTIKIEKSKDKHFSDFWGEIKSLGAWGGDFVMATSDRGNVKTREYFLSRGFPIVISYDEFVLTPKDEVLPHGEFIAVLSAENLSASNLSKSTL